MQFAGRVPASAMPMQPRTSEHVRWDRPNLGDVLVTAGARRAIDRGTIDFTDAGEHEPYDDGRNVAL